MAEGQGSLLIIQDEASMHRFAQLLLDHLDLFRLDSGQKHKIEGSPDDRGDSQMINTRGRESSKPLTQCADNRGRQCLVEGCHGQPLTALVSQCPRLDPAMEQFLSEKRIALALP